MHVRGAERRRVDRGGMPPIEIDAPAVDGEPTSPNITAIIGAIRGTMAWPFCGRSRLPPISQYLPCGRPPAAVTMILLAIHCRIKGVIGTKL